MPSTSVAEITQESLQQILLVVREEMKQMRADILDAHNPAPARPQSHRFGTASSFPSFDNQTHPLDSPLWHQFQTMQQQQQAVQQLQLQLQHRIQQEMYTLQQVQLVTQQQLQETQQQLQKMIHLVQQKQVASDATTSEQTQQLQEMRAAHQTLQKEVVTMKNDLIDLKAQVEAEDASEMDRIADDEDVQDECSAPEDLDEDEYATTEDLDRLIQRVEALECDIFPEQELAADELPPKHETLLSRVMTLKSDFGTCAKQADLAELYARIERLEREDGKAPEQREQTISNPSITRHTQTNPSGYRGDRGSKSNGPRREQATAQAQSAVTTQLSATEQVATQGQVAVAKQAGRKVAEHPQAAAQEQAGTAYKAATAQTTATEQVAGHPQAAAQGQAGAAYKEASPILASNTCV